MSVIMCSTSTTSSTYTYIYRYAFALTTIFPLCDHCEIGFSLMDRIVTSQQRAQKKFQPRPKLDDASDQYLRMQTHADTHSNTWVCMETKVHRRLASPSVTAVSRCRRSSKNSSEPIISSSSFFGFECSANTNLYDTTLSRFLLVVVFRVSRMYLSTNMRCSNGWRRMPQRFFSYSFCLGIIHSSVSSHAVLNKFKTIWIWMFFNICTWTPNIFGNYSKHTAHNQNEFRLTCSENHISHSIYTSEILQSQLIRNISWHSISTTPSTTQTCSCACASLSSFVCRLWVGQALNKVERKRAYIACVPFVK